MNEGSFQGEISEEFYKNVAGSSRYDDIIDMPHHVSRDRPHMPIADRAAQFAPFAALTGHDAEVKKTQERVKLAIDNEIEKQRIDNSVSKHANLICECITYYIYAYQLHCTKQDILRTLIKVFYTSA